MKSCNSLTSPNYYYYCLILSNREIRRGGKMPGSFQSELVVVIVVVVKTNISPLIHSALAHVSPLSVCVKMC